MWTIQRNAASDGTQDSIHQLENRFSLYGFIPKSLGFSQQNEDYSNW
jgi:hypothetical protein